MYIGLPAICNFFRRTRCRDRAPVRSWRTFHPHGQGGIFGISWPTSKLIFTVFFNTVKATASTLRICIKKSILYFTLFLRKLAPRLGARLFRTRRGAPLARDGTPFLNSFEECGAGTWRPSGTGAAQNAARIASPAICNCFRRTRCRDRAPVRSRRCAERRRARTAGHF